VPASLAGRPARPISYWALGQPNLSSRARTLLLRNGSLTGSFGRPWQSRIGKALEQDGVQEFFRWGVDLLAVELFLVEVL
jgi:hypothetical protein